MEKKFPTEKLEKLRSQERLSEMPPNRFVESLGLFENITIADIGCGVGVFTIPVAKQALDFNGKVIALDIEEIMLEETKKFAQESNIKNIEYHKSEPNSLGLEENSIDLAFTISVFHEFDDPDAFLSDIWSALKINGFLIIIDANLKKTQDEKGPPDEHRIPLEKAIDKLSKFSHSIDFIREFYPNKYYLKAKKHMQIND